jgi:hypothetical protein
MHGSDATIMSDNQGVEDLLGDIRTSLEKDDPDASVMLAASPRYPKVINPYVKVVSSATRRSAPSYTKTITRR